MHRKSVIQPHGSRTEKNFVMTKNRHPMGKQELPQDRQTTGQMCAHSPQPKSERMHQRDIIQQPQWLCNLLRRAPWGQVLEQSFGTALLSIPIAVRACSLQTLSVIHPREAY